MEGHALQISADEHEMTKKTIVIMSEQAFRQQLWNQYTLKTKKKNSNNNKKNNNNKTTNTDKRNAF